MTALAHGVDGPVLQRGDGDLPGDHYLSAEVDHLMWGRLPCAADPAVLRVASGDTVTIDTRGILFICGGAFVGLSDIVAGRLGRHESGFGASWHDHEVKPEELLEQVSADDLAEFGLLPEFIGRLPVVSVLDELTEADLARILTEPKNALVKQYRKMFAVDGVDLVFTEQAVNAIASTAITRGTGARGLRSIIEKTLEETMFELPGMDDVQQVIVDAASVRGEGLPKLVREERRLVA